PRRHARGYLAARRPFQPDGHGARRADHPDPDLHDLLDRCAARGQPRRQSRRGARGQRDPVADRAVLSDECIRQTERRMMKIRSMLASLVDPRTLPLTVTVVLFIALFGFGAVMYT